MISSLELAKLCGVSQGTVDRALYDRPGISAKTRERILAMAEQHGYRPHPAARELLTGDRRTVGAIVSAVNSPFFMDLMNTIRAAIAPEGYRFVIAPVDDDVSFRETLEDFAARRARAAIVIPPAEGIAIDPRLTAEMPIASLLSPCQGKGVRPFLPDEVETGRRAAEHLLAHGHTRLLHLTYRRESPAIRDRASGFITTLQKAGAEGGVLDDLSPETIVASVKKRKVTACFCHNDWLALTAQRALHAAGLRIPEEVSLLGVDDSPTFVSLCPEISTLHYPAESIAAAIQVWLTGKKPPTIEPAWVVARKTVRRIG